jgi:hypothetical protein
MAKVADPNKMAKLQDAMSRASKLMQLESNGTLDKIAKAHKGEIDASLGNDASITTESMMTTARNRNTQAPMVGGQMLGAGAANVPSIIRESFANNPIDERALYAGLGDGRDLSFLNEGLQTQQVQAPSPQEIRQLINEGAPQQTMQVSQQIDYPMIRTIVEEIVRKYAVSLKNKILTENKQDINEINTVMLGKSFKFLAKNGDIYEAKLTKVGNINDKKKSVNE